MNIKEVWAVCYCVVSGSEDCIPVVGSWIFDNKESAEKFFNEKIQERPKPARIFETVAEREGLTVVTWSYRYANVSGSERTGKSTLSMSRRMVMSEYDSPFEVI